MSASTPTLQGELLYRMSLEVAPPLDLGATPQGRRLLFPFKGGRFEARFSRHAQTSLAPILEESPEHSLRLRIGARAYAIGGT